MKSCQIFEVWILSDGSVLRCGHDPYRRTLFLSSDDLLITRLSVDSVKDPGAATNEAYNEYQETGKYLARSSEILTSSYENGLHSGNQILLTQATEVLEYSIPEGTLLEVIQGDTEFPETLYASTIKWPKRKGRSWHFQYVLLP
ncbi:MAG: hypothetical protein AAGJ79_04265, partial [Verrucomicrobiota bacterium]